MDGNQRRQALTLVATGMAMTQAPMAESVRVNLCGSTCHSSQSSVNLLNNNFVMALYTFVVHAVILDGCFLGTTDISDNVSSQCHHHESQYSG